jgi:hypothetical protein
MIGKAGVARSRIDEQAGCDEEFAVLTFGGDLSPKDLAVGFELVAIEHGWLEDEGNVVRDGACIFYRECPYPCLALMGDRLIDLLTVGGVGDDFTFEDVEVLVVVGTGDQQPLIGVESSHLFDLRMVVCIGECW